MMKKPPPNVLDLPLIERADMAFKIAVENVMEENARAGLPVHVWRDGKIVKIEPEELRRRYLKTE
jgi:hypothetical protein